MGEEAGVLGGALNIIFNLGFWISIPLVGMWCRRLIKVEHETLAGDNLSIFVLDISLGTVVYTVPLLLSALLGIYRGDIFSMVGWCVFFLTFFRKKYLHRIKSLRRPAFSLMGLKAHWQNYVCLIGISIITLISLFHPTESFTGGRDQGVYADAAVFIAQHGNITPAVPGGNTSAFSESFLPGLYVYQGRIAIQFSMVFPVWLAQAFGLGGYFTLIRLNVVLSALSLSVYYILLKKYLSASVSLFSCLFLAFNVLQIWISRLTLAETLAQVWVLTALIISSRGLELSNRKLCVLGGFIWGLVTLCQVTCLTFLPILLLACCIYRLFIGNGKNSCWYSLLISSFASNLLALLYFWKYGFPYLVSIAEEVSLLLLACIPLLIFIPVAHQINKRDGIKGNVVKILFVYVCTISSALLVYYYSIRPFAEPFQPGIFFGRSFAEENLRNIGYYLTPFSLFIAMVGWLIAVHELLLKKQEKWLLVAICTGVFLFSYLPDAHVSPDLHWGMRRYVPLIIPGMVLFLGLALEKVLHRFRTVAAGAGGRDWTRAVWFSAVLTLFAYDIYLDYPILFRTEYNGVYQYYTAIAAGLDDRTVTITDSTVDLPLFLAFDKNILPIEYNSDRQAIYHSLEFTKTHYDFLTEAPCAVPFSGWYFLSRDMNYRLSTSYLEMSVQRLPRNWVLLDQSLTINRLVKGDQGYISPIGANDFYNIASRGFYMQECQESGQPYRWTDGNGIIYLPWNSSRPYRFVQLSFYSPRAGSVSVLLDDQMIWSGMVTSGEHELFMPVSGAGKDAEAKLTIHSDTFIPSDQDPRSTDDRKLGLRLNLVRAVVGAPQLDLTDPGPEIFPEIQVLDMQNEGAYQISNGYFSVLVKNTGSASWISSGLVPERFIVVGTKWYDPNQPHQIVYQLETKLPFTILPQESAQIFVNLYQGTNHNRVAPGTYRVEVGLMDKDARWISNPISIPVLVK